MGSLTHSSSICVYVCVCVCVWACRLLLLTGWSAPAVADQRCYLIPVHSVLVVRLFWCSRCVPVCVQVPCSCSSSAWIPFRVEGFCMFPGDTQRLPICVPALPSVTAILHMLHLPLAICLAWTLTNELLYFTFVTESSFVNVTGIYFRSKVI